MAKNQLPEGVGKKIVEALKKQTEIELEQAKPAPVNVLANNAPANEDIPLRPTLNYYNEEETTNSEEETLIIEDNQEDSFIQPAASQTEVKAKLPEAEIPAQLSFEDSPITQEDARQFDMPSNVVILRKLVNQLPPGVSKQTGAQIIRQTIEALGIPMKSVIGEAQQVQESLALRTRECQKNIVDCRKQIATLEIKAQQYQKQLSRITGDYTNVAISTTELYSAISHKANNTKYMLGL